MLLLTQSTVQPQRPAYSYTITTANSKERIMTRQTVQMHFFISTPKLHVIFNAALLHSVTGMTPAPDVSMEIRRPIKRTAGERHFSLEDSTIDRAYGNDKQSALTKW